MREFPCGQDRRSIRRALPWQTATALRGMKWPRHSIKATQRIGRRCPARGNRRTSPRRIKLLCFDAPGRKNKTLSPPRLRAIIRVSIGRAGGKTLERKRINRPHLWGSTPGGDACTPIFHGQYLFQFNLNFSNARFTPALQQSCRSCWSTLQRERSTWALLEFLTAIRSARRSLTVRGATGLCTKRSRKRPIVLLPRLRPHLRRLVMRRRASNRRQRPKSMKQLSSSIPQAPVCWRQNWWTN